MSPRKMMIQIEKWPLKAPFRITGYTYEAINVLVVSLEQGGAVGHGEAAGIYYFGETVATMQAQIESLRGAVEGGLDREMLQPLLPPGGARNALDCALWDLDAQLTGRPVWALAGLTEPRPLLTTFTCGADGAEKMAEAAQCFRGARAIKLKLTGDPVDADRVRAVREARPDVWLGVDANQGFTRPFLEQLMPVLQEAGVQLVEQPFAIGDEHLLDGFGSPIPIAADESVRCLADIPALAGRFDTINIKLDKCGGLTEAMAMAKAATEHGFGLMVGNMLSTSLAMAPAFLVGQLCSVVDLDAPALLAEDRDAPMDYSDGFGTCPRALWGYPMEDR